MPAINAARLLKDLRDLARIGAYKTGVHRPTYSADDMTARHWFADPPDRGRPGAGDRRHRQRHRPRRRAWAETAAGQPSGDAAARRLARWRAGGDLRPGGRARPRAALGHAIEVGAWADEEGHFGNFLGSRSFVRRDRRGGNRAHRQPPRRRKTGATRWPRRGWRAGRARGSIRRATAATWRRISSRATSSIRPVCASASSPASSASGNT